MEGQIKQRQLAAILFADIVGYTSLMQTDEALALQKINRYQTLLEFAAQQFNGQVLKNYGDGSLMTFSNSVDAVKAAKQIQEQAKSAPSVPLRIGIHVGEFIVEKGDIYGNGVNLAARIESLGIAGAVLFSKNIYQKIKNKPEFEVQSLGLFDFKNVEEPMEVFALANEGFPVPKREEMQGKLKRQPQNSNKLLLFLLIILVLAFTGYWFFLKNKNQLPESIQTARLAVLPFDNKTNDTELDMLGDMASDWIIQGMMNFDELKVVSHKTVIDNLPYISASTDSPLSFRARTGAEKLIRGNYYLENGKIIIQSQIIDPQNGDIEFAFPEVKGDANNYTSSIKELRERILSYFSVTLRDDYMVVILEKPPKYESYKLFMEAGSHFNWNGYDKAIHLYNKAIEIDSKFYWAYQQIFFAYSNMGKFAEADSMLQLIDKRIVDMTPYEKIYYEYCKAGLYANLETQYEQALKFFEKDPKNLHNNYLSGLCAIHLNRPNSTVNHFQQVDPAAVPVDLKVNTWWHDIYAIALIRLNRLDEAMNILQYVPDEKADDDIFFRKVKIYALKNQQDSILLMMKTLERKNFPRPLIRNLYNNAIVEFALLKDKTSQNKWAQLALEYFTNQPESIPLDKEGIGTAHFFNDAYADALPYYQDIYKGDSSPWAWVGMLRLGSCYAKLNQAQNTLDIIEKLKTLEMNSKYHRGEFRYATACIYAMLGEKERAVQNLKLAYQQGHGFHPGNYQDAFELIPLHGYPPYETFVKVNN